MSEDTKQPPAAPATKFLMANNWKLVVTADRSDPNMAVVRIALGHPGVKTFANVRFPLHQLATGIEVDIGRMMNIAMGIPTEEA